MIAVNRQPGTLAVALVAALLAGCGDDGGGGGTGPAGCELLGCPMGQTCVGAFCVMDDTGLPDVGVDADSGADDADSGAEDADAPDVPEDTAMDADDDADASEDVSIDVDIDVPQTCRELGCPGRQTCDEESGDCQEPAICLTDADCGDERVCLENVCTAAADICRTDQDCPMNSHCLGTLGECEADSCSSDDDCASTNVCNTDDSLCVECLVDDDCTGGLVCSFDTCDEPDTCSVDEDCLGSRTCVVDTCQDPACNDDAFEPNEEAEGSPDLSEGLYDLTLCDGEEDYFTLTPGDGNGVIVIADAEPLDGSIELQVLDADEGVIYSSTDASGTGHVSAWLERAAAGETYYLRARALFGDAVAYRLGVTHHAGGFCVDDDRAPNHGAVDATPIDFDELIPATICPGTSDFYAVDVGAGQTLTVNVADDGSGPVGAALYRGTGGTELLLRDTAPNSEKSLTYLSDSADTYLIEVFPIEATDQGDYILTAQAE